MQKMKPSDEFDGTVILQIGFHQYEVDRPLVLVAGTPSVISAVGFQDPAGLIAGGHFLIEFLEDGPGRIPEALDRQQIRLISFKDMGAFVGTMP